MNFRILTALLCATAIVAGSSAATAGYVTTNASVHVQPGTFGSTNDNPGGLPLVHLQKMDLEAGQLWTNQVTGDAFAPGALVRTVGAFGLASATNGFTSPILLPDGSQIHAVFAVEGVVTGIGEATFTGGSVFFVSRQTGNPGGNFNPVDPLTWNVDNAYAKFDLLPAQEIIDGGSVGIDPAYPGAAPASDVNVSGLAGIGPLGAGIFAFGEDLAFTPGFAGTPFTDPGLGANVGSEWLTNYEQGLLFEGIAAYTDQTIQTTVRSLSAAQIAELDRISSFASGFTGAFSEGGFNPQSGSAGPGVATGDFSATLSGEIAFIAAVPEPSSLAIFGLLCGGAAVRFTKRRLKKA